MAQQLQINFNNPDSFTCSDSLIDISSCANLKSLLCSNQVFGATYNSSLDASFGCGSLTASPVLATRENNKAFFSGNAYIDYSATGNAPPSMAGTIRFKLTPNYSGSPSSRKYFFTDFSSLESDLNSFTIYQETSGWLVLRVCDNTGNYIIPNNALALWNPTSGQEYEIEIDYSLVNGGVNRVFINGALFGSYTVSVNKTRNSTTTLRIGNFNTAIYQSNFYIDDFVVINEYAHTSNYTPGYQLPESKYSIANPTVTYASSIKASSITGFGENITKQGQDNVKYILTINNQMKWLNNGVLEESNGTYSKANTAQEINSYASTITSLRVNVGIIALLHSENGASTPELNSVTITYESALPDPVTSRVVEIEGFIYDINGPVASLAIQARPYSQSRINAGVLERYKLVTIATTDANGWFSGVLFRQPEGKMIELRIDGQSYRTTLPDQETVDFSTLELMPF